MMYIPTFKCKHCGELLSSSVNGDQGLLILCSCKEAREEWERKHRAEMERRKRRKRGR